MSRGPKQLRLDVRVFVVRALGFGAQHVQAASRSAAKYRVFKQAREAGYFSKGFRQFIANGVTAKELRR